MGTVANVIDEWAAGIPEKESVRVQVPGLMLRWINEAQLRFASRTECLQGVWEPTVTSTGNIALPNDFLREYPDRVKWDSTTYLSKIDYPSANLVETFTDTKYYSIFSNSFYVWLAAAGSPEIPYVKKPTALTTLSTDALEIPTEYHRTLMIFLDAAFERYRGNTDGYRSFMAEFDAQAQQDGFEVYSRRSPARFIKSNLF